jgi:two-component system alkaline phosphatase synthesis response regulator PhoP
MGTPSPSKHPPGPRVLLVEDEPDLQITLGDRLANEGYRVDTAGDGEDALARALGGAYDLVILDLRLPRRSGFDVCRILRQRGVATPVLMLTARRQLVDRVLGLKLGADDYLTKPFDMAELLARVEACLRRTTPGLAADARRFGPVAVDVRGAEVVRDGRKVDLTAREFQLLRYFIDHPGVPLSRDRLLDEVWGRDAIPTVRTVDVHVAWLRRKLEPDPRQPAFILTVHGVGYKFAGPG